MKFIYEGDRVINGAGRKVRFAAVATTSVSEVSHTNACVLPKPLKQNITNPAVKKIEVKNT